MDNLRNGEICTICVCGKCETQAHINPLKRDFKGFSMIVWRLYCVGWGKSDVDGFVCPDCVERIVEEGKDVWVLHRGMIDSAKRVLEGRAS